MYIFNEEDKFFLFRVLYRKRNKIASPIKYYSTAYYAMLYLTLYKALKFFIKLVAYVLFIAQAGFAAGEESDNRGKVLEDDKRHGDEDKISDKIVLHHEKGDKRGNPRPGDGAEGKITGEERHGEGDNRRRGSGGRVGKGGNERRRDCGVAAFEIIEERIESAKNHAEAGEDSADIRMAAKAEEQAADEDGDKVFYKLDNEQLYKAADAVYTAEIGKPHVACTEGFQPRFEDISRGEKHGAEAAHSVGNRRSDEEQKPIDYHSLSPFWRMVSRTGVPSRPKTERIWFSR